ncbi:MAG: DUF362 domain-containing protein, partial [Desulfobacteraceae bacterium]|nr:DUF362 domain-containing protein [Desulfobacteraceae bacterium]
IDASVRKAIDLAGGLTDIISGGDTVLIKPNVVNASHPDTGRTTDPRVCKSIANMVKEIGAKPIIAESSMIGTDTEEAFKVAGYKKLRDEGFEVIDLKREETIKVPIPKGKSLKEVSLPKVVVDANVVISVPSMKTHGQAKVTLSLKNMKGILPDIFKRKFHLTFGIFQGVADLCTVLRPALAVVDGIIAQEGLGSPVEMDLVIAGKDPVAVDTITGMIMGFEPGENETVNAAVKSGIGTADPNKIEVVGENISTVQREFKRTDEAINELISIPEGFQLILAEKACTGCRNSVLVGLMGMKARDLLDKAAGWTVVAGKVDKLPEVDRKHLLLVGKCTARFKNYGIFVDGCPPIAAYVAGGILRKKPPDELTLDWGWVS